MSLFYSKWSKFQLFWYVDTSYLSNPHKAWSQMRYVAYGSTTISWRSVKQTMETWRVPSIKGNATKLYEDNVAYIAQSKEWYIKGDKIKHISPKFFYIHQLQKSDEIVV